jgi:putative transposase
VIFELRHKYKVTELIKVAGIARSTYYYQIKQIEKPDKYAQVKEAIAAIFEENKHRYGYRRITMELHNRGYCINHKTVQRLMRQLGLFCRVRLKKYNSYKGAAGKTAPNLLQRDFKQINPIRNGLRMSLSSLYLEKSFIYHPFSTYITTK